MSRRVDHHSHHQNVVDANTVQNKLLTNIQNANTQDGLGGGNKLGVMADAINTNVIASNAKLDTIATNTANINVNVGDVEINTADLEVLQLATKNTLFTNPDGTGNTIGENASAINANINTANGKLDTIISNTAAGSSSGLATEAKQDDQETTLDAILAKNTELETLLTTIDADTNDIKIAVESLDNAIAGNELQVDIVSSALPSGAATETTLQTIAGFTCDTTDVTVTTLVPGVAATSLGKAIQSAQGATDTGVATLAVRNDTLADLAGADHDYAPLQVDATGGLYTKSLGTELLITAGNSTLVTIDADTNAIKIAVESLDNAVDGNYLNVNQNIAGTDVDSNSGNKSAATQRVVIATDDINLSAIKASLDTIDNAMHTGVIPSAALNVSVGTSALPSGAATDNSILSMRVREDEATINGQYLMGVSVVRQDTLASLVGTSGDNTQMSVDANGALYCINSATDALLTTIDEDTNAIKIAVESLDNAVDGNYLNVNQNIAGTDVDSNSGNKSAASQRVVIATDDINLSAIKTAVEILDNAIDGSEMQVDIVSSALPSGAATQSTLNDAEVHLGSIDGKITQGNDATLTNAQQVLIYGKNGSGDLKPIHITNNGDVEVEIADFVKGQAAMAASFPVTIASNQSNLNVAIASGGFDGAVTNVGTFAVQAACSGTVTANLSATDNAVLDEIQTNGDNIQTKLDTIDSVLDNSLVKQTLATTSEVKEFLSSVTINSGAQSAEFDTENYDKARFFGESTASVGTDIILMGSNVSGGTFYVLGENLRSETIGFNHYVYGPVMEALPRYIKILNKSGSTNYIFNKLYFQGSGGRLAV